MRNVLLGGLIAVLLLVALWFGGHSNAAVAVVQGFEGVAVGPYGASEEWDGLTYSVAESDGYLVVDTAEDAGLTGASALFSGNVLTELNYSTTNVSIEAVESMGISSLSLYLDAGSSYAVRGYVAGVEVVSTTGTSVGAMHVELGDAGWQTVEKVVVAFAAGNGWVIDNVRFGEPSPSPSATPEPSVTPSPSPEPSPTPEPTPVATPTPMPSSSPEPSVAPTPSPTPPPVAVVYVPPSVFEPYVQIPEPTPVPTPEPTPTPIPLVTPEPVAAQEPVVEAVVTPEPVPVPTPEVTPVPEATPLPEPVVVATPEPVVAPVVPVFKDVGGHWAAESIGKLRASGIIQGDGDGGFYPERLITRNEFVAMVLRVLGIRDVGWAAVMERGVRERLIVGDEDGGFRESARMTREEGFTVLGRIYGRLGVVPAGDYENPYVYLYRFKDYVRVSDWAMPSVGMGVKLGLIRGDERGMLAPGAGMTRGEVAAVLGRLVGE
jgi:hypothetical protein